MADEPTRPDPGPAHEPGKGKGYHEEKWKGMPMYQCDSCHFNSMNEAIIQDHVENAAENNARLGR
jgi:hypothetical protein